jgi:low temperature requirement protein LtrA
VVSSAFAVAGGLAHGQARALLWVLAVGVDLAGAPGHHVSRTTSARKRAVSAGVSASVLSWFMTSM